MQARRRGFGTFLFGVLFGIILVVGGVVTAVMVIKVENIEKWTGQEIVKEQEVKDKSLFDVVSWAIDFAGSEENLTINKFNSTFSFFQIPLEFNGMKIDSIADIPFTKLGENINLLLDTITLESVEGFGVTLPSIPIIVNNKTSPILEFFDIVNSSISGEGISLDSLSTDFGMALPSHAVIDKIKTIPLSELGSSLNDTMLDLTIGEVIGVGQGGLMGALENVKIRDLNATVPTLTLGQVMQIDESSGILWHMRDSSIENLSSSVQQLTLEQILVIDGTSPNILKALKSYRINELGTGINNLKISDVITSNDTNSIISKVVRDNPNAKIIDIESVMVSTINAMTVRELCLAIGVVPGEHSLYARTVADFFASLDTILNPTIPPIPMP